MINSRVVIEAENKTYFFPYKHILKIFAVDESFIKFPPKVVKISSPRRILIPAATRTFKNASSHQREIFVRELNTDVDRF